MARGYSQSRSEDLRERNELREPDAGRTAYINPKFVDTLTKPLIASLAKQSPLTGDKLHLDAIFEEVSNAVPSGDFLEKEYSNRARAAYAGIATDMLELNLLQAEKAGRVKAAEAFGPRDAEEVGARMDKQIADAKQSIKDGIIDLDKEARGELDVSSLVKELAAGISKGIKSGAERASGKKYAPTESRERKKQLDSLYNFISQ
jgi:hypothetical protein